MTPTNREQRHLKFGRFGRHSDGHGMSGDSARMPRRGRWTGYQPLSDAVTQARLAALTEGGENRTQERE